MLLRRGVRALESIADAQQRVAQVVENEWERRYAPKPIKKATFASMDVEEVNRRYHAEQEARMAGIDPEDIEP